MHPIKSSSVSVYRSIRHRELTGKAPTCSIIQKIASQNISKQRCTIREPFKRDLGFCQSYDIQNNHAAIASTTSIVYVNLSDLRGLWKRGEILKNPYQIKIRNDRVICAHASGILILKIQNGEKVTDLHMNHANTSFSCEIGDDYILALTREGIWKLTMFDFNGKLLHAYNTPSFWPHLFRPAPPIFSCPYFIYALKDQIHAYDSSDQTTQPIVSATSQKPSFIYNNQLITTATQRHDHTIHMYNLDSALQIRSWLIPGLASEQIHRQFLYAASTLGIITEIDLETFKEREFESIGPCSIHSLTATDSTIAALISDPEKAVFWQRRSGAYIGSVDLIDRTCSLPTYDQGVLYAIASDLTFTQVDLLPETDEKQELNT